MKTTQKGIVFGHENKKLNSLTEIHHWKIEEKKIPSNSRYIWPLSESYQKRKESENGEMLSGDHQWYF